eukprot:TRINITY_DN9058_c0_g1_i1.p1 TRINITY_DN9058_c0_g1~~TRINITY_DN9058_c0_g1_i1.p1  ORF type:complete len:260 (-),score=65.03 TRINITY_DN9058_c0_g1_i1:123-857(-)
MAGVTQGPLVLLAMLLCFSVFLSGIASYPSTVNASNPAYGTHIIAKVEQETETSPNLRPEGQAPASFTVKWGTTVKDSGDIVVQVTRAWAPLGADRFYQLVTLQPNSYFTNNGFFRVLPGFVVQFGINGTPLISGEWNGANATIKDDPVLRSNTIGMMSYAAAGPNTRTTQVFINLGDNSRLDGMGFAPFAKVIQGMDVVQKIFSGYKELPNQGLIYSQGDEYLKKKFPLLDYIVSTTVTTVTE